MTVTLGLFESSAHSILKWKVKKMKFAFNLFMALAFHLFPLYPTYRKGRANASCLLLSHYSLTLYDYRFVVGFFYINKFMYVES